MSGKEFFALWGIAIGGSALFVGLIFGSMALLGPPFGGVVGLVLALASVMTVTWFFRGSS